MKVHDEHLSKEEKQVVADEEEAERKFQAEKARAGALPSKEGPAGGAGFKPPKEAGGKTGPESIVANPTVVAPAGAKILREVAVGGLTHCYVIGLSPEYAGSAFWMVVDAGTTREEQEKDMDRRLRRA